MNTMNGVNEPQFFVKSKGCWTGLHGEDCLLSSFNINLGPDNSEWTIIPFEAHEKITDLILCPKVLVLNQPLYHFWQHFFFPAAILKEHGIPHVVVTQKPGEAVFVSGQALHQVRNLDYGVNVAWNLAPLTTQTIRDLMTGFDLEVTHPSKRPIIPVLRAVHLVLARHFPLFGLEDLKLMGVFLLRHL